MKRRHFIAAQLWYGLSAGAPTIITPFLNLFYASQLRFTPNQIGFLSALRPWVSAPAGSLLVALADRLGAHRTFLIGSYMAAAFIQASIVTVGATFPAQIALTVMVSIFWTPSAVLSDACVIAAASSPADFGRIRTLASLVWTLTAPLAGYINSTIGLRHGAVIYLAVSYAAIPAALGLPYHALREGAAEASAEGEGRADRAAERRKGVRGDEGDAEFFDASGDLREPLLPALEPSPAAGEAEAELGAETGAGPPRTPSAAGDEDFAKRGPSLDEEGRGAGAPGREARGAAAAVASAPPRMSRRDRRLSRALAIVRYIEALTEISMVPPPGAGRAFAEIPLSVMHGGGGGGVGGGSQPPSRARPEGEGDGRGEAGDWEGSGGRGTAAATPSPSRPGRPRAPPSGVAGSREGESDEDDEDDARFEDAADADDEDDDGAGSGRSKGSGEFDFEVVTPRKPSAVHPAPGERRGVLVSKWPFGAVLGPTEPGGAEDGTGEAGRAGRGGGEGVEGARATSEVGDRPSGAGTGADAAEGPQAAAGGPRPPRPPPIRTARRGGGDGGDALSPPPASSSRAAPRSVAETPGRLHRFAAVSRLAEMLASNVASTDASQVPSGTATPLWLFTDRDGGGEEPTTPSFLGTATETEAEYESGMPESELDTPGAAASGGGSFVSSFGPVAAYLEYRRRRHAGEQLEALRPPGEPFEVPRLPGVAMAEGGEGGGGKPRDAEAGGDDETGGGGATGEHPRAAQRAGSPTRPGLSRLREGAVTAGVEGDARGSPTGLATRRSGSTPRLPGRRSGDREAFSPQRSLSSNLSPNLSPFPLLRSPRHAVVPAAASDLAASIRDWQAANDYGTGEVDPSAAAAAARDAPSPGRRASGSGGSGPGAGASPFGAHAAVGATGDEGGRDAVARLPPDGSDAGPSASFPGRLGDAAGAAAPSAAGGAERDEPASEPITNEVMREAIRLEADSAAQHKQETQGMQEDAERATTAAIVAMLDKKLRRMAREAALARRRRAKRRARIEAAREEEARAAEEAERGGAAPGGAPAPEGAGADGRAAAAAAAAASPRSLEALAGAPPAVAVAEERPRSPLREFATDPEVYVFFLLAMLLGVGHGLIASYDFIFISEAGGSESLMGYALVCQSGPEIPAFFFFGKLLQAFSITTLLFASVLALGLRLALYPLVPLVGVKSILLVECLHGLSFAVGWSACAVNSSKIAPPGLESTTQAIFQALWTGVGTGLGAFLGGFVYHQLGGSRTFFAFGVAISSLALLAALRLWIHRAGQRRMLAKSPSLALFFQG